MLMLIIIVLLIVILIVILIETIEISSDVTWFVLEATKKAVAAKAKTIEIASDKTVQVLRNDNYYVHYFLKLFIDLFQMDLIAIYV